MVQALKIGSLLDHGKYRVEEILGHGGFGITYLATDLSLGRFVAIKEFFPKEYCDRDGTTSRMKLGTSNTARLVERLKAMFIKEARNIASLDQHQGIIRIHTVFEENNTAYYVMDYIEGESLSEMVKNSGKLSPQKAIRYITQIGKTLEYIHKKRMNHLDVKPANIMIREKDDKAILIDFGLSKQYDTDGGLITTMPLGISHGYAPLEQYNPEGVSQFSPQSDIYSLAATLYFCVSGKTPPGALKLANSPLSFPSGFPSFLKEPIRDAMQSNSKHRISSVSKFIRNINNSKEETQLKGYQTSFTSTTQTQYQNSYYHNNNSNSNSNTNNNSNSNNNHINTNPNTDNGNNPPQKKDSYGWIIGGWILVLFFGFLFFDKEDKNKEETPAQSEITNNETTTAVIDTIIPPPPKVDTPDNTTGGKVIPPPPPPPQEEPYIFYQELDGGINLPNTFRYKGEDEELGDKMFGDGTASVMINSINVNEQYMFKIVDANSDHFDYILKEHSAQGNPSLYKIGSNYRIASGLAEGNNGKTYVYYCKWVQLGVITYTAFMEYPLSMKSKYDNMIPKIFNSFPNVN